MQKIGIVTIPTGLVEDVLNLCVLHPLDLSIKVVIVHRVIWACEKALEEPSVHLDVMFMNLCASYNELTLHANLKRPLTNIVECQSPYLFHAVHWKRCTASLTSTCSN